MPDQQKAIRLHSSLVIRNLAVIFGMLVMIFAATGYYRFNIDKKQEIDALIYNSEYTSVITARSIAAAMWNLDQAQVQKELEIKRGNEIFCGARVLDARGSVFADSGFPQTLQAYEYLQKQAVYFGGPVDDPTKGEFLGTLEMCVTRVALEAKLNNITYREFWFFVLTTIFVLVASYFSQRILTRPLEKIGRSMVRLANTMEPIRDPELLEDNEIGILSKNYNRMVKDLSHTYEELRQAKEEAESADKAKSDFLSNMSHELRTPLNSIVGMADLLSESELNYSQREMIETLNQASKNLLDIVNDILDLSKIESGRVTLEAIAFNPYECVTQVVNMLWPLANEKGLMLTFNARDNAALSVIGDPTRYTRIATNLISNAVRYTQKGQVNVYLSTSPLIEGRLSLKLEVMDTGIGIKPEKLGSIFNKFEQADSSITRKYGGSGLGLAITKQLLTMMKGDIHVESVYGEGSRFTAIVPFDIAKKEQLVETQEKTKLACGILPASQVRVLVAEDHVLNQAYMKKFLPSVGIMQFAFVENGQAAVEAVERGDADIVLMDCHMPIMSGYEATQTIRGSEQSIYRDIPIIAMTANAMIGEREKCIACGMDDYMSKPIGKQEFLTILSRWVRFDQSAEPKPLKTEVPVLDLSGLRTFSAGNKDMEREFALIFYEQSTLHIAKLGEYCVDGMSQAWKETAHLLKGGAATIGAMKMRSLCAEAQEMVDADRDRRVAIYALIKKAFDKTCDELKKEGLLNYGQEAA